MWRLLCLAALLPACLSRSGFETFEVDIIAGDDASVAGDTHIGGDTFAGDAFAGDTFAGDTFAGDGFAGDAFAGDAVIGGDTRQPGDTGPNLYPPRNLTAEALTAVRTQLQWQPPIDPTGLVSYRIWRDGEVVFSTTATGWIDLGVEPGGVRTYEVTAFYPLGDSEPAGPVQVDSPLLGGAVRYVRPPPDGDDDNPGTMALPWATLQYAVDQVGLNDTVVVGFGNYAGFVITQSQVLLSSDGAIIDTPSTTGDGIRIEASWVIIDGFEIRQMPERGISVGGGVPREGIILRNNQIQGSARTGISLSDTSMALIEDNLIVGNADGILLSNDRTDSVIVRYNIVRENAASGLFADADSGGGDGVITDLFVGGNTFSLNGMDGIGLDGVQSSRLHNNLIVENVRHGIRSYAIDGAAGSSSLEIVNNTIIVSPGGGSWCVRLSEEAGASLVFNNILLNEGVGGSIGVNQPSLMMAGANAVVDRFTLDGDNTTVSLADWQTAGLGAGSFVTTAAATFEVGQWWPAAGAGAHDGGVLRVGSVAAPLWDADGRFRPMGEAIDIGAFERP